MSEERNKEPAKGPAPEIDPASAPEVSSVPVIPTAPGGSDPMVIPPAVPHETEG